MRCERSILLCTLCVGIACVCVEKECDDRKKNGLIELLVQDREQVRFEAVRTRDVPYREHYWTFIDEIDFFTNSNLSSAVSVNTGFGATGLLMAGLLGFSMRKRNGRK